MAAKDNDDDLDDLLDDALKDFEKPKKTPKKPTTEDKWASDFLTAPESGETVFQRAMSTPPNSFVDTSAFQRAMEQQMRELQRLSSQEDAEGKDAQNADGQLDDLFSKLKPPPPPQDFEQLLSQLSLDGRVDDPASADAILPMMETMMQSLLSRELLYPAIKDLADKFPDWLADNREELSVDDFERYNKQFEVAKKLCHEFESSEADKTDDNKEHFDRVMGLMHEMQVLGNPPKALVGDGGAGTPDFAARMPEQCKVS